MNEINRKAFGSETVWITALKIPDKLREGSIYEFTLEFECSMIDGSITFTVSK